MFGQERGRMFSHVFKKCRANKCEQEYAPFKNRYPNPLPS